MLLYAPVAPCTSHINLENNNEVDGHDPIYDHELYLDVAAMLSDDNNDHNNHLCGQNIEQNIRDRCTDSRLDLKVLLFRL